MPFKSKSQAKKFYELYSQGKLSYQKLMEYVHATPDLKSLPDRLTPKRNQQTKTDLAIKGLV